MSSRKNILIIYTGGTIGSVQDPRTGSLSPLDFDQITTHVPELNRAGIGIRAVSFNPPIDSSEINPKHWARLVETIVANHDNFDGFVILHGTDTMAFTASALSFMIEGLRKPVILTGSQLPIGIPRTDGRENLLSSVMLAAHTTDGAPTIQEVAVYFGSKLLRGNRSHKESAQSFDAIISPNYPALVDAGVEFKINYPALYRDPTPEIKAHTRMDPNVAWLPLFPGMSFHYFDKILDTDGLRGIVLSTYGSGNAPSTPEFKNLLFRARELSIPVVNITQCGHGGVHPELYATSLTLSSAGVISGGDMTNEAALTKLMITLGTTDDLDTISAAIRHDLRGELST